MNGSTLTAADTPPMLAAELTSLQTLFSLRLVLPVILLALLWTWESVSPFFEVARDRGRHALRNIAIAVFNAVVTGTIFGTLTVLVADWTVENRFGLLQFTDEYATVRFAAGLILLDAWMYVWHRLNHRIPLLCDFTACTTVTLGWTLRRRRGFMSASTSFPPGCV